LTKLDQIRAAEARLLLSTYDRSPVLFTGGNGVYITDEQGEQYLDLLSGIGVNALGYNHPAITKTIIEQSQKLIHTSNLSITKGRRSLHCG
jgi:acetylornithine aminotransferase/acetylornithine/N-succinyldiaminopimelate aminotransferase